MKVRFKILRTFCDLWTHQEVPNYHSWHRIKTNAANIGIPEPNISVRYRSTMVPDWVLSFGIGRIPASTFFRSGTA
jgi:hypothetical protein